MFPLTHKVKNQIEHNDAIYPLNLAFNNVLSVFEVLEDEEITPIQSLETSLYLLIGEDLELSMQNKVALLKKIFANYIGQQTTFIEKDLEGNPMPVRKEAPVYSFSYDGGYIYAAFMQAYGVNLIEAQNTMSWSEFKSLFAGLPEETAFRRIVNIRSRELPEGGGTSQTRKELIKLKEIYQLPSERSDE